MTYSLSGLEADFSQVYRTLRRERIMRERVLRNDSTRAAKIAEIDTATSCLVQMKDQLKKRLIEEGQQETVQASLLNGEVLP